VLTLTVFNQAKWNNRSVLKHDMSVYYSYLPAAFIYQDLSFEFVDDLPPDDKRELWSLQAPNGNKVQKMTMGMAMMYAPFFGLAHGTALLMDITPDGYSWVYHFYMALSALVFAIGALFIQRKLLRIYFDEKVVALTLLAVALGTNYYYYATSEGPMSHIHNFFLISLFIWQSIKWLATFNWKNAVLLGVSFGLIVLIRPVNGLVIILPMVYGVRSMSEQALRFKDVFSKYGQLLLMVGIIGLMLVPQLVYWKMNTGDWVYYSYQGETFFFDDPKIMEGFFGFRKGWFVYAPVMILSILGMGALWNRKYAYKFKLAIPVFFAINTYVVFSWWCWWYGGSFGARPMIDASAIMSIPLAAFIASMSRWRITRITTTVLISGLVVLSMFQTMQYRRSIIHWDSMTKETYFLVFGKTYHPEGYPATLKTPDYDGAKVGNRNE
jgi:hypothetical protein